MKKVSLVLLALNFIVVSGSAQTPQIISADSAARYFAEAKKLSDLDNGRMWGYKLYGPMILVDTKTGTAVANEQDSAATFLKENNVFTGTVPKSFGANTAKLWGGKIWTVILWPLPKNKNERGELMMHELFHQLQLRIGLPAYSPACSHLDKFEGRLLLKLELEALRKVINAYPAFSKSDLENAIALRWLRYKKFPEADSLEHSLEINEGLATYTGFMMNAGSWSQKKEIINKKLNAFYTNETFVRSLAYITGYLYGFLLSQKGAGWSKTVTDKKYFPDGFNYETLSKSAGFDKLLINLYKLSLPPSLSEAYESITNTGKYNYAAIYNFEKLREDKRLMIAAENKRKFIDGPVLELPNEQMNFNFNPNEVQVLEEAGPIYPTFTGKAAWGLLEVKSGGALVKDWMYVYVPLPENFNPSLQSIITIEWQLDLNAGWTIIEGKRKGDYKVVKK